MIAYDDILESFSSIDLHEDYQSSLGSAQVSWEAQQQRLILDSGKMQRQFQWTGAALVTSLVSSFVLSEGSKRSVQSWSAEHIEKLGDGEGIYFESCDLLGMRIEISDDGGFTSKHLCVQILIRCSNCLFKQEFWIWPNVGMRMQWHVRGLEKNLGVKNIPQYIDSLNLAQVPQKSLLWGYFNDTQNRNRAESPLLQEREFTEREWHCDWSNGCALIQNNQAYICIKESHKCVNQSGIDSGSFILTDNSHPRFSISGWGIAKEEWKNLPSDSWLRSWATWYTTASADDIPSAVRLIDRTRFSHVGEEDDYVIANTWGSGHFGDPEPHKDGRPERRSGRENVVLKEIESCGNLGIDVLQIDDGWQTINDHTYDPGESGWHPDRIAWPQGWKTAVEQAWKSKVTLGLWAPAMKISADELHQNYKDGCFQQYKLDFAHFTTNASLCVVMDRCRTFVEETDHKVRINWDVTENHARFGYYFGRELGSVFLANRKPDIPESTVYVPWLVLRDTWQLARYTNVKQFQISIQNPEHTDKSSDAYQHSLSYCLSIASAGLPLFFHRTSLYTLEQRDEARQWLSEYHHFSKELQQADCSPILSEPSNASWTGFHFQVNDKQGYLLILREIQNNESARNIVLPQVQGKELKLKECFRSCGKALNQKAENRSENFLHIRVFLEQAQAVLYRYELK